MRRLSDAWRAIHFSSHGEYSQQRWDALQQYQQRTSVAHALGVCILTPLPSLCFVIGIEAALPLSPIADGWAFPSTLTVRLAIGTAVMAFSMMNLSRRYIPELRVTPRRLVRPALLTGIVHTSFLWAYSALWVFPLPFAIVQTTGVFTTVCIASFLACLGTSPFREVPDFKRRVKLYMVQLTILNVVSMAYPAYGAFYRSQHGVLQIGIVVLPLVMKSIAKAAIAKVCKALNDDDFFLPEAVHFSVELLHTLFISTCVQTTTQPLQIALAIVVFDFLPLVSAIRNITNTIRGKPRLSTSSHASFARVYPESRPHSEHQPDTKPSLQPSTSQLTVARSTSGSVRQKSRPRSHSRSSAIRTGRALFMCENHLLVEYLECVIPVCYSIYVVILYHLPNAQFYETMQTMHTPERLCQLLASVTLYVGLQLLSVVLLSVLLSWRVMPTVSSILQLSFVLETQAEMIQMWFFIWMPLCILSVVEHGGMDFTLRFEWMAHKRGAT